MPDKILKIIIAVLIIPALSLQVFSQKKITEEVNVDWWVLPIFALDAQGNSVKDLREDEISLKLNNKHIKQFNLFRQLLTGVKIRNQVLNPIKRDKIVFLIFESTLSTKQSIDRSKSIARKIVEDAEKNIQFVVMSIQPFAGLKFMGGPTRNKNRIKEVINTKIKGMSVSRNQVLSDFIASTSSKRGKYTEKDIREVIRPGIEKYSKHRSKTFFQSFELLYYAINSINDNKFIYLFTEGISKTSLDSEKHMRSVYRQYIDRMAEYLGKSNAVLFIINPSGTSESDSSGSSGEDSLRYLALESGGKYFEGSNDNINLEIGNINNAYYEIAFSDSDISQKSRKITIKSKRPGVSIHTMRSIEKNKVYSEMNQIEKEILALNLLSQNQIFRIGMEVRNIMPKNIKKENNRLIYSLDLPPKFIGKEIDLFKIQVDKKTRDADIVRTSFIPDSKSIKITFSIKNNKENYFVLINKEINTALIEGAETPEKKVIIKKEDKSSGKNKVTETLIPEKIEYDQKLIRILKKTADYCKKLQDSVFHFVCKEKIVEITDELEMNYKSTPGRDYGDRYIGREGMDLKNRVRNQIINKYSYDYQLIKFNNDIKEQRLSLKGNKSEINKQKMELKIKTFFSKKVVLSPITLLSHNWQNKYYFENLGMEKIKGKKYIKLRATPVNSGSNFLFGTIWIDQDDYSVRRIIVNPRAIKGYKKFLLLAEKFRAELTLSAEIQFEKKRNGIRFPSKAIILENYRGGPIIPRLRGKKGWNRSKVTFSYSKYQFFNVDTEVITN